MEIHIDRVVKCQLGI